MNKKRFLTFILLISLVLISSSRVVQGSTVPLPVWSGVHASRVEKVNAQAQHNVEAITAPDFGKLPLSFVPNAGQTDPAVCFRVHSPGGILSFTSGEVVLSLPASEQAPGRSTQQAVLGGALDLNMGEPPGQHRDTPMVPPAPPTVLRLRFEGTNPAPEVTGAERLPGIVNYFIGNDPTKWRTNLPTYAGIAYRGLYPGIDLRYDGAEGVLKGTYTVAPGADPSRIRWRYDSATSVRVDEVMGDLLIRLPARAGAGGEDRTVTERTPVAWQSIDDQHVSVSVSYAIGSDGSIGFAVGDYDPAYPLTLDPVLIYSTYLGGSDLDDSYGIAVDSAGSAYIVGRTLSTNFPTTTLTLDGAFNGGYDIFVAKLNADGNALVYSTYLGGSSGDESTGIAVDNQDNALVTGYTSSTDFPTQNALYSTLNGISDIFVAKLNATGNALIYSTYLGGSSWEYSYGIAVDTVDNERNAYVAGSTASDDFPTKKAFDGTLDGGSDGTVTKLSAAGELVYSTYLGGSSGDAAYGGIAVYLPTGEAYVTGYTQSADFPTTTGALDGTIGGTQDAFVAKLEVDEPTGIVELAYSTYLGGSSSERGLGIALDRSHNAYVTGYTYSADFPTVGAVDGTLGGTQDAFVTKLNADGSALLYSTYLGGSGLDAGDGIAVDLRSDNWGDAYVTGYTQSADFPTTTMALDGTLGGTQDAFMTKLDAAGSMLLYSTYLGGSDDDEGYSIAVDGAGDAYVTGWTESIDFPTRNSLQADKAGPTGCGSYDLSCRDTFVTKIGEGVPNWAFLLYLDGDNNLYPWMRSAIHNLETATSNPNLIVLALLDGNASGDTWRYHVQPGGSYTDGINRWSMGERDMSDPQTLSDFILWARDKYPAKHYYLAVADHGRGTSGIAQDATSGNTIITVAELRTALQGATSDGIEPLDVVHYDACLMGMLENAYQIQNYADYLVASENLGWSLFDYALYATQVTAVTTPEQLSTAVVDQYHSALTGYPRTISALDLGQAGMVEDAVTALASALQASLGANKYYVGNTRDATQKFDSRHYCVIDTNDEYLDLYDFARLIKQNHPDISAKNAAQGVMNAVDAFVLAEQHASDDCSECMDEYGQVYRNVYWDLTDAHGVSIYFPPAHGGWGYNEYMSHVSFRFTADGQWDEFLQDYYGLTGLPPETPVDPGLPPMSPPTKYVYLPIVIRQ